MAVLLVGAGGLFTRAGKLIKIARTAHAYSGGDLATFFADAIAALGTQSALVAPLPDALAAAQAGADSVGGQIQASLAALLCKMVNDDTPLADNNSVPLALAELRRQMVAASASVPACAVSITPAAVSGNSGTGVVVGSVLRGDGLEQHASFAEVGELTFTGDGQGRTATAGSEPWSYAGDYPPPGVLGHDWPGYSGAAASGTTIDSQVDNAANLLANGNFETFTVANVPDSWIMTGTPGTHFGSEASIVHRGAKALKIIGDGTTNVALAQTITAAKPDTVYAVNLWLRLSAATAAGQILLHAFDGTSPLQDDTTGAHSVAIDLTALATPTVYTPFQLVFVTPKVLPATVQVRLRLTTPLATGKTLYLDSFAVGEMTRLYPGGPALAVFSGATPFVVGDRYLVTVANDYGGVTYGGNWQQAFQRYFGTDQLEYLLPYSGSPTVANSLVTA